MLGKLVKYEFKATARVFIPLFAALLTMSAVSRLTLGFKLQTPHVVSMVLSILLIVAAFVMTLILTVQRFYKNFLTDEGYLMFTLPVGVGKMISGKLIVAAVWTVVCTIMTYCSLALMAFDGTEWQAIWDAIRGLGLPSADLTLFIVEFGALILVSLITGILTIYASIALSMLSNTHRVALSFALYIGLNTVMQILMSALLSLFNGSTVMMSDAVREFFTTDTISAIHTCALIYLAFMLAYGAAMFFTTRYMLKNKLNLQ